MVPADNARPDSVRLRSRADLEMMEWFPWDQIYGMVDYEPATKKSQEGCCTIALSCVVGGSRLVSPVLPFPFGGRCVGRLGAATSLTACFAQPFLFDLWRSSGLPHPTHRYPRRPCHATVSRGVATKRTDLRLAVSSSSMASDPTPPLGFSFLLCAGGGTQRRQRHGNNGNESDNGLGKNGYLSTNGTPKSLPLGGRCTVRRRVLASPALPFPFGGWCAEKGGPEREETQERGRGGVGRLRLRSRL